MNSLMNLISNMYRKTVVTGVANVTSDLLASDMSSFFPKRFLTLETMHKRWLEWKEKPKIKPKKRPLDGKPFAKGIILKTLIKKPRKPNSANRKCVLVKLSTGKEMIAFVPGEGHNLQEHQTVLCKVKRLKDVPGVQITCVRGKYDLPHVKKSVDK